MAHRQIMGRLLGFRGVRRASLLLAVTANSFRRSTADRPEIGPDPPSAQLRQAASMSFSGKGLLHPQDRERICPTGRLDGSQPRKQPPTMQRHSTNRRHLAAYVVAPRDSQSQSERITARATSIGQSSKHEAVLTMDFSKSNSEPFTKRLLRSPQCDIPKLKHFVFEPGLPPYP